MKTTLLSEVIETEAQIPKGKYVVYALKAGNDYIVLGHGKRNRAKVIFDDLNTITYSHIKSFKVRLYHLFSNLDKKDYVREITLCDDKKHAQEIEKIRHNDHEGSNTLQIDPKILDELYKACGERRQIKLLLNIALTSSYSGLSDLRKWCKKGRYFKNGEAINEVKLINQEDVDEIIKILQLSDLKTPFLKKQHVKILPK